MQKTVRTCGVRLKNREERNAELRDAAFAIVAGVENYSAARRNTRAADVEAAFPPVETAASVSSAGSAAGKSAKTSKNTAMKKTAAKSSAKAGTKTATVRASAAAKTAAKSAAGMKAAAKTASSRASKGPTPAGMSVGPHDGDLC